MLPLFLSPQVGVVADVPHSGCSTVYRTTDFVHWRAITPPNPTLRGEPCPDLWTDASFVSPDEGWILGRDGGGSDTVLYRTLDGGSSWTREPGGSTGSNGGWETIGFADARFGWRQQFAGGSSRPYTLELTHDGGTTWSVAPAIGTHGGDQNLPVVFATPSIAFAGDPLTYSNPSGPGYGPQSAVWRTTDGGNHWARATVTAPSTLAKATAFYGLPHFFGDLGVLPVTYTTAHGTWVAFYRSTDSGITWTLGTLLATRSDLLPVSYGGTAPTHVMGAFPVVTVASRSTFWVIGTSTSGVRTVSVTHDAGGTWASTTVTGIPPYQPSTDEYASQQGFVSLLEAAGPTRAWIEVTEGSDPSSQTAVLLATRDGGKTWAPVRPSR